MHRIRRALTLAAVLPVLLLPAASAQAPVVQGDEKKSHLDKYWQSHGCAKPYTRRQARAHLRRALMARRGVRRYIVCAHTKRSARKLRTYLKRYRKVVWLRRASPRTYARWLLRRQPGQFSCLDQLVMRESHWNVHATNSDSGAYGIPQALPGYKMASAGSDWRTNGRTQVRWMLSYIRGRYGTPCGALSHSHSTGWY